MAAPNTQICASYILTGAGGDNGAERLLARVIHSLLLSDRRSTGLPAKEPNQEPTQADIRRHPATPGDCRAWSSAH